MTGEVGAAEPRPLPLVQDSQVGPSYSASKGLVFKDFPVILPNLQFLFKSVITPTGGLGIGQSPGSPHLPVPPLCPPLCLLVF